MHGRVGLSEIELSLVDLGKVRKQVRLVVAAFRHELVQATEQFVIGNSLERIHSCLLFGTEKM